MIDYHTHYTCIFSPCKLFCFKRKRRFVRSMQLKDRNIHNWRICWVQLVGLVSLRSVNWTETQSVSGIKGAWLDTIFNKTVWWRVSLELTKNEPIRRNIYENGVLRQIGVDKSFVLSRFSRSQSSVGNVFVTKNTGWPRIAAILGVWFLLFDVHANAVIPSATRRNEKKRNVVVVSDGQTHKHVRRWVN